VALRDRPVEFPDDVWPVRDFLSRLYPLAPAGTVWDVRRWDGSIFYSPTPGLAPERAARSRLWVTGAGRIVAAAMSEGGHQIHPHVDPEAGHLLEEVIAWSEEAAAAAGDDAVLLTVWDHDAATQAVADARGYRETGRREIVRSLRAGAAPPEPTPPAGYALRPTRDEAGDHQAVADLLNAAFGRTSHTAAEHATFARRAPSFRRDTDLVAEAPDGSFAAYAALCWDSCNRRATFEPVCTHPDHRRRGLAAALMLAGLRRAIGLGAAVVDVATGDADPANALYASLPFAEVYRGRVRERPLRAEQ
jgi:GNAT superfamily N-acetyltransferase